MKISAFTVILPLLTTNIYFSRFALAEFNDFEFNIQPRFEIGFSYYELDFGSTSQIISSTASGTDSIVSTTKQEFNDFMPFIGGGITFFVDRFFLDLSAQKTFNGESEDSSTIITSTPDSISISNPDFEGNIDRDEYAISLGYSVTNSWALFTGYKWADNSFDNVRGSGSVRIQQPNNIVARGTFITSSDFEFDYDGPFIGSTYIWNIKKGILEGGLAASIAAAFLEGEFSVFPDRNFIRLDSGETIPIISSREIFSTDGDTIGISLGLVWRGATRIDGLSYSLGVNGYNYKFEPDNAGKAEIDETFINFKLGISYVF